jgi:hypothetical protein
MLHRVALATLVPISRYIADYRCPIIDLPVQFLVTSPISPHYTRSVIPSLAMQHKSPNMLNGKMSALDKI